eukprot:366212-Chlamydomonas_euryale.AAC.24
MAPAENLRGKRTVGASGRPMSLSHAQCVGRTRVFRTYKCHGFSVAARATHERSAQCGCRWGAAGARESSWCAVGGHGHARCAGRHSWKWWVFIAAAIPASEKTKLLAVTLDVGAAPALVVHRQINACAATVQGPVTMGVDQPGEKMGRAVCVHGEARCLWSIVTVDQTFVFFHGRMPGDTLGNRQECEQALHRALLAGKSAVVDRCNFDERQRDNWLRVARNAVGHMHTVAVQLLLPLELCIQRVANRTGHPTLARHNADEVCRRFYGDFQVVQRFERFSQVLTAHSEQDVVHVTRQLLVRRSVFMPRVKHRVSRVELQWPLRHAHNNN